MNGENSSENPKRRGIKDILLAALILFLIAFVSGMLFMNFSGPGASINWDQNRLTLNGQESKSVSFKVRNRRDLPANYEVELKTDRLSQQNSIIIEDSGTRKTTYRFNNLNSEETETIEITRNTAQNEDIELVASLYLQGENELVDEDTINVRLRDEKFLGLF